jgi:Cellulose binding domain
MRPYAGRALVFVTLAAGWVVACAADAGDPTTPTVAPDEGDAGGDGPLPGSLGDAAGSDVGDGDADGTPDAAPGNSSSGSRGTSSDGSASDAASGDGGEGGGSGPAADGGEVGNSSGGSGSGGITDSGSGGITDRGSGFDVDGGSSDGGSVDEVRVTDSGVDGGTGDAGDATEAGPTVPETGAACVTSGCPLKVQSKATAPLATTISANLNLVDNGATAIDLATVKVRYYFTADGDRALVFICDYAGYFNSSMTGFAVSNVIGTFVAMGASATSLADTYLELSFTAGTLPAGSTASVAFRIHDASFATSYTQTNDWSNLSNSDGGAGYLDATHVAAYTSGALVWGIEP